LTLSIIFFFLPDLRSVPATSLTATFNTHVTPHAIPTLNIHAFFSRQNETMWCDLSQLLESFLVCKFSYWTSSKQQTIP